MSNKIDFFSPWVINTVQLGRNPGKMLTIERDIVLEQPLGLELFNVPAGSNVVLTLRAEAVAEGVLISGSAKGSAVGECARCLEPVHDMLAVEICELFAYPESTTSATTDADEVSRLEADHANVEQAVRDAIILAMPAIPYCRDDCRGLCPECGELFVDLEAGHAHERVDSRWEGLRPLLQDVHHQMSRRQE